MPDVLETHRHTGVRVALGVSYRGDAYHGWQSQPDGRTVQDRLEQALAQFAEQPIRVHCAGRTDAGVHALNQVVHLDAFVHRESFSWVRGTNRYLPRDIAVQWCVQVGQGFDARRSAQGRRYRYVLREAAVRPSLDHGLCGWTFRPLECGPMERASAILIGEHDFSAFRAAGCQAASPIKTMRRIAIGRRGAYWTFDFDASAFLHHMVRNIMGCLVAVGQGIRSPDWMAHVLAARDRALAAPTFAADGLYFIGPYYDSAHGIPDNSSAPDFLC